MREQAEIAIATADVIMFIVDVRQGLQDSDSKVADTSIALQCHNRLVEATFSSYTFKTFIDSSMFRKPHHFYFQICLFTVDHSSRTNLPCHLDVYKRQPLYRAIATQSLSPRPEIVITIL